MYGGDRHVELVVVEGDGDLRGSVADEHLVLAHGSREVQWPALGGGVELRDDLLTGQAVETEIGEYVIL